MQISKDDQFIYCGTTTGDIMRINMKTRLLAKCGPVKAKYSLVGEHGNVIIDLELSHGSMLRPVWNF